MTFPRYDEPLKTVLQRWATKRRPQTIIRRAAFIVDRLGEYYWDSDKPKPGHVLPERKPEQGYRYQDNNLTIEANRFGLVRLRWLGREVLLVEHKQVQRLNYGQKWIDAVNELYADLKSKQRREHKARKADL